MPDLIGSSDTINTYYCTAADRFYFLNELSTVILDSFKLGASIDDVTAHLNPESGQSYADDIQQVWDLYRRSQEPPADRAPVPQTLPPEPLTATQMAGRQSTILNCGPTNIEVICDDPSHARLAPLIEKYFQLETGQSPKVD